MTKSTKKGKGRPKTAPTKRVIKGKGDYKVALNNLSTKMDGLLKKIPKGAFSKGGNALGGMLGGSIGAAFGKRLGGGLSAITGYGDYQVSSNTLSTVSTSVDMVPQFARTDHSVRVCHREFIGDLKVPLSPDDFNNSFVELINPANAKLFPWLSRMATLYTQYKIHGMVVTYKTMSSNYSASGGPLGTVIIATNYNVNDQAFSTKVQMENSEFAVSCNPSTSLIHAIECDPKVSGLQTLYVLDPETQQTGAISDPRFYHYGKMQIATSGLPGTYNTTMGELWISYDIELMKPVIGANDAPTPPGPTPVTQLGVAINSLPTGGIGISATSEFTETTLSQAYVWPGSTADTIYNLAPSTFNPEQVIGDVGLWVTPLNANGAIAIATDAGGLNALRMYRAGTYEIDVYSVYSRSITSELGPVNAPSALIAGNNFTPTFVNSGAGVDSTRYFQPNTSVSHWGYAGGPVSFAAGAAYLNSPVMYRTGAQQWTAKVVVTNPSDIADSEKYVQMTLPWSTFPSASVGGTYPRVVATAIRVRWLSVVPVAIVV